ncbi:MAG: FtsX-like permease family protein [Pseudomonadota bacterium]
MRLSQFIAMRYLRSNSKRSFVAFINVFSIAGISLGIAALIIVLSVMNGLENQLKQRILGILPHVVVTGEAEAALTANDEEFSILLSTDYIETEVMAQSRSELKGLLLQGIDPQAEEAFSIIADKMISGSFTSIEKGQYNILIGSALATQMRIGISDQVRIISPQTSVYSPLGQVPSQRLFTVSGIFNLVSEMDDKIIISHVQDVARLMRRPASAAYDTRLFLQDAFEIQPLIDHLRRNNVGFNTWQKRQGALFEAVTMEKNMMGLMLFLVILVAGFNVISALVMVVAEKTGDIAILQTQGMLPAQIREIFFFNGLYNALAGVVFGAILGGLGVIGLNPLLKLVGSNLAFGENGNGLPILTDYTQLMIIMVITIILCALASVYPAVKASKVLPARGLRTE